MFSITINNKSKNKNFKLINRAMTNNFRPKRKINILISVAGLHIGGAEVVIKNLVHNINKKMFNVTILCLKGHGSIGEELLRDGFDIISFDTYYKSKVDYFTFLKFLKIIRQKKIDIVHTHSKDALADAAICKILLPGLKLIHTFHFGNYLNQVWKKMWIEQVFSRVANRLIAVGEIQRNQIKKVFKFNDSKVEKVWNGIPLIKGNVNNSYRESLGIRNRILIGTICTLTQQKGLFDLLSVAAKIHNKKDNVRFVIVGDGPLRSDLEKKLNELEITETVIFTGWIPDASKNILHEFDIFFQPSLWEAMSIVILETMAAGIPIVATRVGENTQIIEDEVDGILVDTKDVDGMTLALSRLIENPDLRNLFGSTAKEKVSNLFTVEHMVQAYENIYIEEFEKKWFTSRNF